MLYTFPKTSPDVIWSLKEALSHFPVTFFPFCPNNAFMFAIKTAVFQHIDRECV